MGEVIDGAVQQAPQPGRQSMMAMRCAMFVLSKK